ncbi:hypothetical protein H4R19_000235 [Coemansia spiralis]|nr:hypothetical protein H4R19_000235 [Coemansia spiralis]
MVKLCTTALVFCGALGWAVQLAAAQEAAGPLVREIPLGKHEDNVHRRAPNFLLPPGSAPPDIPPPSIPGVMGPQPPIANYRQGNLMGGTFGLKNDFFTTSMSFMSMPPMPTMPPMPAMPMMPPMPPMPPMYGGYIEIDHRYEQPPPPPPLPPQVNWQMNMPPMPFPPYYAMGYGGMNGCGCGGDGAGCGCGGGCGGGGNSGPVPTKTKTKYRTVTETAQGNNLVVTATVPVTVTEAATPAPTVTTTVAQTSTVPEIPMRRPRPQMSLEMSPLQGPIIVPFPIVRPINSRLLVNASFFLKNDAPEQTPAA